MLEALSLYYQQQENIHPWWKELWVNPSRPSGAREIEQNKRSDGAHRLYLRWGCHEKVFIM